MSRHAYHRLRRDNEVIGASWALGWGFEEPEPGRPMPPLTCFFPIRNMGRMRGTLEVWLFRTETDGDLFREEKIGEITVGPDHPCREELLNGEMHLMLEVFLDGHGPEQAE